jgi:hypothetical protein
MRERKRGKANIALRLSKGREKAQVKYSGFSANLLIVVKKDRKRCKGVKGFCIGFHLRQ